MKTARTTSNPVDAESVLVETVTKLRELLESIELHGDGEHGSTIQDVARISVALTSACAELRQHAKAAKRQLASYSTDQLIEHIKAMPDAKREGVIRELTGSDNEEPLL